VCADEKIKLTMFDLCTGISRVVQYPKSHNHCEFTGHNQLIVGHTYSPDSRYLAVAERHHGKEHVGVYDVALGYQLLRVK